MQFILLGFAPDEPDNGKDPNGQYNGEDDQMRKSLTLKIKKKSFELRSYNTHGHIILQ